VCRDRYVQFGCEGQAGKIQPRTLVQVASDYATGKLAQVVQ
jgi:fructose-bisphosphate aldolase class II